jgi:prepilin-type N-terminal cleavage/methylation domain-containing protein
MKNKGFTLLEVMVAILVVNVALLALLSLMNYTSINSRTSANRLIALNLAQEGIEIVRNSRDAENNWTSWFSGNPVGDYRAEISLTSPYAWFLKKNPSAYQLKHNSALGLYHYQDNGDPLSIFSRKIWIEEVSSSQKKVIVMVTWTGGEPPSGISCPSGSKCIAVENWLYKWRD